VSATIKKPVLVELNVSIPWDSDTYYELALASTIVAGEPQLKICSASVSYAGLNIPCFDPGAQLFIASTATDVYDKLVWDLRRIRNAAIRSAFRYYNITDAMYF